MHPRSSYPKTRLSLTPDVFPPVVEAFLRQPLAALLSTVNPSGTPQQTVMWFKYEDGDFLFTTLTGRVKFRNYLHDPRGSVAIVDPDDMFRYVIASGRFAVDDRDPVAFYRELGRHYLDDEGFARWGETATTEGRTVLRLTPTRRRIEGFPSQ
ncbi:MAG: TIGR03618 family F420-dependent PPOX class oxidoreductase [Thermomicrobia bacterium]|nr:TIGR03618 family F420-dependent PPOX class oxidoreductase [Thermomicrobia bacterium]